jgi:branched-chain amino acid transport system permease protein
LRARVDAAPVALRWVVGIVVGWTVLGAVLPDGLPLGIVVLGATLGSLTGLTAIGIVLVYRASRVVNFAQAALGSAAGVLAVMLFSQWHWSWFLSLPVGLVVAAGAGAGVELLVVRRFFWAPRLILTLATIGLAQILGGIELVIPSWFGQPLVTNSFRTPLSASFTISPVRFTGNHVVVFVVVPIVVLALGWFLRATAAGTGIRAASENAERAMTLGIPVRRLSTIVWAIAAVLSALTVLLTAPLQPLPPTVLAGPALLLPALAAAVVAGMASLPRAFAAGVGIGVLQQVTFWNTSRSSLTDVALLVVILGALLLQRHRLARGDESSLSSWVGAADTPPLPRELRSLPEVIWGRRVLLAVAALLALAVPAVLTVSQLDVIGTIAVSYAIVGVSLVVLTGWGGQLSLGQFALAGVGAVAAANVLHHGGDLIVAIVAAMAAGAVGALLIGLPALRIRGLFLGVTSLAFAVALSSYFLNPAYFAAILPQQVDRPVVLTRFDLLDERTLYYFALVLLGLALAVARAVRSARPGRVFVAVRDNEAAAGARGVHALRVKLLAFGLAGALAGMAGSLHVLVLQGIGFGTFSPAQSFEAFSMVVIGGLTSPGGAVVGAVALRWAQYALGGGLQLIVTGTGVLLLLLVFPGGLGQIVTQARRRVLRRIADRRGLLVPSLIADRRVETDAGTGARTLGDLLDDADALGALRAPARAEDEELERLRREADDLRSRLERLERAVVGQDGQR